MQICNQPWKHVVLSNYSMIYYIISYQSISPWAAACLKYLALSLPHRVEDYPRAHMGGP